MSSLLVVLALATWRVSSLLAREEGPIDLLLKLRYRLGVRYDEHSRPYGQSNLSKGILCIWCNSVWVGTGWVVLAVLSQEVAFFVALPFALSAAAIFLEEAVQWKQQKS